MTSGRAPSRPRSRTLRSGAFFFLALVARAGIGAPGWVAAQDPVPPAGPPPDSAAADSAQEEGPPPPPPSLPALAPVGPVGWEYGVWEWDRAALLMLPDVLSAEQVLGQLRQQRARLALVVSEYGDVEGLVGRVEVVAAAFHLDPAAGGIRRHLQRHRPAIHQLHLCLAQAPEKADQDGGRWQRDADQTFEAGGAGHGLTTTGTCRRADGLGDVIRATAVAEPASDLCTVWRLSARASLLGW